MQVGSANFATPALIAPEHLMPLFSQVSYRLRYLSWLALALPVWLTGCPQTEVRGGFTDVASSDVSLPSDGTATGDASSGGDSSTTGDTTTTFADFKPNCSQTQACATGKTCVDGVCVVDPTAAQKGEVTDPFNDFLPTADPVQLGCVGVPLETQLKDVKGPSTVTLWGRVDRFGGGPLTANVEVSVFELSKFHPEACAGIVDDDARAACFVSDKVGTPIGKATSIDPDTAKASGLDVQAKAAAGQDCVQHLDCPSGYECRKDNSAAGAKICLRTHGLYAIEGVPTNTRLVVRVHGLAAKDKWHDSYYWDIVLFADHIDKTGAGTQPSKYVGKDTYRSNPTIVGEGQWQLVPTTIGVQEIELGHGVIGGRIRDCGIPDGRGGWAIHNAKVGMGVLPKGFAYFNDNEDDTVPVKTATATDTLGRFAAVDMPAGHNRIAAATMIGGKPTPLGSVDVFVVPDALMIVSLPGRIPVLTK